MLLNMAEVTMRGGIGAGGGGGRRRTAMASVAAVPARGAANTGGYLRGRPGPRFCPRMGYAPAATAVVAAAALPPPLECAAQ
jgi:hypothetical protein